MLPDLFPQWRRVHVYFQIWSELDDEGVSQLERALKKSGWCGPRETGAQCLQRVLDHRYAEREDTDTAKRKDYDAGKKVSGIKRHITVDTQGFPHAVVMMLADVTDRNGALEALERSKRSLKRVEGLLFDGGYTGKPFAQGVRAILGEQVTVQIVKRSELHTFSVMLKALDCVERSFAWLEKNEGCGRTASGCSTPAYLAFSALLL